MGSSQHFDYAKRLINQRMSDIGKLEMAFDKPAVDKMGNPIVPCPTYNKQEAQKAFLAHQKYIQELVHKPKKSL